MAKAKESGLSVHSWTVRDDHLDYPEINSPMEEYFRLMVQVNVDGLFCDFGGNALMYSYAF
jgi:glycerophosphoryl diester phosphodiesterase